MGYIFSVTCRECSYSSKYRVDEGEYFLSIDNQISKHIRSQVSSHYCSTCDSIEMFFLGKPYKTPRIIDLELKLSKRKNELNYTSLLNIPEWIYRLVKYKIASNDLTKEYKLSLFDDSIKFWDSVNVHPRCLKCGTTNPNFKKSKVFTPSDRYIHKCGGALFLKREIHFQGDAIDIIHDFEGKVLSKKSRPSRQASDLIRSR